MKKALIGAVLGPGHPVWEALRGRTVAPGRSAFIYLPDDEWGVAGPEATPAAAAPGEASSAQGWQSDPVRRKQVEDAAQDQLMGHDRDQGWTVRDTRSTRPFDAVAERGDDVVHLEAEGTQTAGAAVQVTVGEVEHARRHPGQCVMGVLSDIRLDAEGQVDPGSGMFRVLPFEPEGEALEVTGYQWRLPGEPPHARPEIRIERGTVRSRPLLPLPASGSAVRLSRTGGRAWVLRPREGDAVRRLGGDRGGGAHLTGSGSTQTLTRIRVRQIVCG